MSKFKTEMMVTLLTIQPPQTIAHKLINVLVTPSVQLFTENS